MQITDLRFNTFNIVHPDLRLLNPTDATKQYVTCSETRQQSTPHGGARSKTTKMNRASLLAEMRDDDDIMSPIVQPRGNETH
jgi:hypothetical protein